MRFYPSSDPYFFVEVTNWQRICRTPNKIWKYKDLSNVRTIQHWRDLEGAQMQIVEKKDLYFKEWMLSRIRPEACLPIYYCTGNRFIRLEKAFPAGFKCAPLPINLEAAREVKRKIDEAKKAARKAAKEAKKKNKKDKKGKKGKK
ncbi:uncharacterized protein LOC119684381 [Teleopsis dalmanni]|uniref:uncharacterized protein LOC119682483 n=1 Tax=Teleopsis dalmanni TaxID=139649 RepID=UPI000D32C4FD|nr:uncharacterized protein LOC119682483 [Teleopsis dalmanni]XP_037954344.1 uncharacterized protein LOC119684381 [Teleopsis dalmanni]